MLKICCCRNLNLNLNYGLVDLDIINEDVCDNLKKINIKFRCFFFIFEKLLERI